MKVTFIREPPGKTCRGTDGFLPEKTSTDPSEWTIGNLGGHCKPIRSKGGVPEKLGNLEINVP